ncbi:porin family protein [Ulvibacter litoralis]|uniref:Outer membrane protein beta-barrel domain-containing protein n=1 Tax=Ulvibacter litoralis TaxID=227084 RepID=A0A1G7H2C1_9FLAO|nr:porin family protein [Ulvibacter litoralis]GHC59117.1 hypothetical protein GCM10008083_24850 [Ulvibacter litoralis]SDE94570.1 Outer membrane protein beta-barrel domain-containing protein [Ulvibacter litoralis]
MRKTALLIGIFIILFSSKTIAQTEFGAKAGLNFSKYSGSLYLAKYQFKMGFYAGGFAAININEKFKIHTELLFALQGSNFLIKEVTIRESPYEIAKVGDFKTKITETTISVPLVAQYYLADGIYFETGPQMGLILKQKEKVIKSPTDDPEFNATMDFENNTFDFGLVVGAGYELNEELTLNLRYYFSTIEHSVLEVKSAVINLGLEYEL